MPPSNSMISLLRDPNVLFSGAGISFLTGNRSGTLSYGYSSFKGKRPSMEDFFETKISEVDGHGGARTAECLKNNLFKNLSSLPDFINDTKSAIAVPLSDDHKTDRSDERQRIEEAGGFVVWAGRCGTDTRQRMQKQHPENLLKKRMPRAALTILLV